MAESPMITPLVPLGEFITKLGRPPSKDSVNTYIMRLREQGWDVSQTVKKALECGALLEKEVCVSFIQHYHCLCWLGVWFRLASSAHLLHVPLSMVAVESRVLAT